MVRMLSLLVLLLVESSVFAQTAGRIRIDVEAYSAEFAADALPTKLPLVVTAKYIPPTPPPPPPPPPNELSIIDFGAKPNDSIDDTVAINTALAAGKSQGKAVRIPAGVFHHSNLIFCDSVQMIGGGDSSELVATNFRRSSIYLRGKKPTITAIKHTFLTAGVTRQSHGDSCSLFVEKSQGFVIENVTVLGSPSSGILNWGAVGTATDPCLIKNCRVAATLADGIHNTNATNFVRVEGCTVRQSNDDGIAVVSYRSNASPSRNITIINNTVENVNWGRGIAVAGGEFIEILDNRINRTTAAGLYLVSEGNEWDTFGLKGISAKRNTIDKACSDANGNPICPTGHPGILLAGRVGFLAEDITIESNTIRNPTTDGIRVGTNVARVVLAGNTITGTLLNRKMIAIDPAATNQVTIRP